jgi:hypothetical protein
MSGQQWNGALTQEAQGLVLALPGVDLVDHPLHLLQVPAHQIQAPDTGEVICSFGSKSFFFVSEFRSGFTLEPQ